MGVIHGDCLEVLRGMPDCSIDAVVTDPPSGISFMNQKWDHHRGGREQWVAWLAEVMAECLRVTKPGGYGLVWALPRTSHWTGWACESAGWEVRDRIHHLQGQGFPKSLDVGKAIDKAAGAERPILGTIPDRWAGKGSVLQRATQAEAESVNLTAPATDDARRWDGWGTAIKPAAEDWWLLRKPLSEKSVAANVLRWGTGGINVDGCRVGTEPVAAHKGTANPRVAMGDGWGAGYQIGDAASTPPNLAGRWPSNVVLSHGEGCVEVGERKVKGGAGTRCSNRDADGVCKGHENAGRSTSGAAVHGPETVNPNGAETVAAWECEPGCPVAELDAQSGGGSRFYPTFRYVAKAPTSERPVGPDGTKHPTVKPLALMRWLCRLIVLPGGTVLDPFAGSGATLEAALLEGFDCIAIEAEATYLPLIQQRIARHAV